MFIWFLSYLLKDFPFFRKSKFHKNMQIYDYSVIFLGITKLFSQSHVLWSVKVNSNCFQRCFFYRKSHSKRNFKKRYITFFWNLTLLCILWKQKHRLVWNIPKFKTSSRFTKLFLMPSPQSQFYAQSFWKSSFAQCQFLCIPMKTALSKGSTHWLLVAYSC